MHFRGVGEEDRGLHLRGIAMLGKKKRQRAKCLRGVGEEDRGLHLRGVAVLGKKKKTKYKGFESNRQVIN